MNQAKTPNAPVAPWKIESDSWSREPRLVGYTPEKLGWYEKAVAEYEAELEKLAKASREAHQKMMESAINTLVALGVKKTAQRRIPSRNRAGYKTETVELAGALRPFLPEVLVLGWPRTRDLENAKSFIRRTREIVAAEQKKSAEVARKAEEDALVTQAVEWLVSLGKKPGTDFTVANAVSTANDIAFEAWREAKVASGQMFSFCGEDSCEDCDGWDGKSRRCQCGNRRVSWTFDGDFKEPSGYAEAY